LQEVEVVIEGVATVIRELEDNASIPPSLRSTMIDQLAAEENDQDFFYRTDLEATHQRLSSDEQAEGESSSTTSSTTVNDPSKRQHHPTQTSASPAGPALASSGFTRGEKMMFVVIAVVAILNVCVCVPLYYHFANQDD
jgi:cobalamin biosynthesis Mg chelatase CobN